MATKQTRAGKPREPEVIEPHDPDLAVVETDGSVIAKFIEGIVHFFREARELEVKAVTTLSKARALKAPKSADDDSNIQTFIKQANADRKTVDAHWSICQTFSQVHRRLTSARARATDPLEEAARIAQRLHNDYAEEQRRIAAREQERLRQEAEEKARQDREREAQQLEAAALEREQASAELSEREQHFVRLVADNNQPPALAAFNAGFKNQEKAAARLMATPKIIDAIKATRDAIAIRQQAAATREKPLDVRVETVKPAVGKAIGGSFDRTTHSAEVLDQDAFIAAVISGKHGIPWDVLTVNQPKLNEYARSLQERINLWPGIRHNRNTKTV